MKRVSYLGRYQFSFFDVLRKNGFGAILMTPFSKNELHIAGFGFVDDTNILQTGLESDDYWETSCKPPSSSRPMGEVHIGQWRVFDTCQKLVNISGLHLA